MQQVLEDGRLSDSMGRVVSFKSTLVIMTSNVGSNVIAKGGGQLGFALPSEEGEEAAQYGRIRTLVMEELKVLPYLWHSLPFACVTLETKSLSAPQATNKSARVACLCVLITDFSSIEVMSFASLSTEAESTWLI